MTDSASTTSGEREVKKDKDQCKKIDEKWQEEEEEEQEEKEEEKRRKRKGKGGKREHDEGEKL